ncbi:unnamed protein product, partial [Candidula unifasciata]
CKCSRHGTESCNSPTGPCVCKSGTQGAHCDQDVNECPGNPCPAHSTCINTWGSFYCVCWNGSNVDPSGFCNVCPSFMYGDEICNRTCPCSADNTQFCDNVNGICFCKPGWVGRGCSEDRDECRNPRMCPRNSDCINVAGKYLCECHSGYVMNRETNLCE